MKLNYVTNVLKPIDKYCTHKKTQSFVFKEAVSSNSLWFPLVLKTEAGTTNYSVFTPSLNVRMKILSYILKLEIKTSCSIWGHLLEPLETHRTGQTFPGVALSCQSNLSKPEYDSSVEFPLTGREFMEEQRKRAVLCSWALLDSLKPVGRWRSVQTVEDNRRKVLQRNKQTKTMQHSRGICKDRSCCWTFNHKTKYSVDHTMRIISVWTPWILVSFFFFI